MKIGFDIDGTLTDFEKFVFDNAITFMKKKYNMNIINENGYDLDQVFDIENQLLKKGFSIEEAATKTEQIMNDFWERYYIKYILTPFREGVVETINRLYAEGNEIFIVSSRKRATEDSFKGKIVRSSIDLQFALNKVKYHHLLLFENDKEKLKAIKNNYIDIMVDDKPELISQIAEFTDAVCITSSYNNYEFTPDVETVDGYNHNEIYNSVLAIKERNNETVYEEGQEITGIPSVDKLWLKQYSKGDLKWSLSKMSPYERMKVANINFSKHNVVSYFKKTLTTAEFFEKVDNCAKMLSQNGIKKGDIVPLLVINTPETAVMVTALLKLMVTIVPISPEETAISIENKLNKFNSKEQLKALYIVNYFNKNEGQFLSDKIESIRNKLNIKQVICASVDDSMPKGYKIFYSLSNFNKRPTLNNYYISFDEYLNEGSKINKKLNVEYDEDYTAVIIFTGGTIESKGVKISGKNIDAEIRQFLNNRIGIKRAEKISGILPFDHIYGLLINLIIPISRGIEVVLRPKPERKKLDQLIVTERVNYFATIPVLLNEILENKKISKADLAHVKGVFSGSEEISNALLNQIKTFCAERNSNIIIIDGYGSSELTAMCLENGIPIIGAIPKIVDPGTEEELGYNQTGELCISSGTVMQGYYDNEEKSNKALRVHEDGKVWLHTGDLGSIDLAGRVTIRGRIDQDIIKVNGQIVNLFDVGKIIEQHPMVRRSVVIKHANEQKGHVPVAFIEIIDGFDNEGIRNNIIDLCSKSLTYYEKPESFVFVNSLPLTPRGKINRKVLVEDYNNIAKETTIANQKVLTC
ncbi:MAG: AMP-binding protein [Bacilli bacterium]|nr:AMP-binding protein [Bacilli bacterium]MDD4053693.1 AMP-binding protein [Bacilli bacterium]MDD4411564.1 AMP-binding protein [Bacilli bacterium]